ncbi:MAG: nickel pincer cofactor biosynthesis protein LarC [Lentisphaerae bacterium]|nr:nickel pincer cofactor biosynthesis protein LarC [Victivallaceae bacterium]MDD3703569.1 nickel pincer cofactor biosynthesis protein LarC [Victivallaceae bacterium]NLK83934.1 nickel pincer cofactor biosynthesis protein LarC [Lentisphaerota bacterium]
MKIVRFDSVGGASGDMILGALVGLGADISELSIQLSALLPDENFSITSAPYMSYGINGIQAIVTIKQKHHDHDHHHDDDGHHHDHKHERSFSEISDLIKNSILPEPVITQSLKVFTKLATAEAKIHNVPVENVHFHEVGAVDSIIDIVGSCLACHLLGIDAISVSTLPTGSGTVKCRHGIYPVPAPATTEMLTELATMPCDEEPFELVTPTGAALLASWSKNEITSNSRVIGIANSFGQHKLKTRPNLLRAILYEVTDIDRNYEKAVVLETNIDDCSPEIIGNLCQKLTDKGVLDVWTTSATMKKQRLGVILSVLVKEEMKSQIIEMIFRETTTFGIREYTVLRQCLERSFEKVETLYGTVRVKTGKWLGETLSRSPEFEDCRLLSEKSGVPLKTIQNLASK